MILAFKGLADLHALKAWLNFLCDLQLTCVLVHYELFPCEYDALIWFD